jgi:aminoglycoside phosphotransferase (APT) family kinase protein
MIATDTESDNFRAEVCAALAQHFDDPSIDVERFSRRGEGYSWETYLVSVTRARPEGGRGAEHYAVKREPSAGLLAPYDVQLEVDLLKAAGGDIGCPVPHVVTYDPGSNGRRGFYVMGMVDGVVPMPWDVRKVVPSETTRHELGIELAGIMAKLHSKDIRELTIRGMAEAPDGAATGTTEVEKWYRIYLESMSTRLPVLDLAFSWLLHRADSVSGRVALVHNDLRVGNVIVKDGRVAAVLDWETAEFTDPAADLAKFNLPTFRGRSSLASGLVEWDAFLDAYEAQTGWRPHQQSLAYWTVVEIAKTIVGALRGVHFFDCGRTEDIRYANMGFQINHSVKWLVELFENGQWGR